MSSTRNRFGSLRLLLASCLKFVGWLIGDGHSGARSEVVRLRIARIVADLDRGPH